MLFIQHLAENPFFYFAWVLIVVFSICVHEFAHAYVAYRLGDDTAAQEGHLSLNPMIQMGPTSLIFLALVGMAWGSVPVNINRFREPWAGAVVAFAGPASNLILSFLFTLVGAITFLAIGDGLSEDVAVFFIVGATANGMLFVLNMLPAPMFDGWSVFSYFYPRMSRIDPVLAQNVSLGALLLIFFTPLRHIIWGGGSAIAGLFNTVVYGVLSVFGLA